MKNRTSIVIRICLGMCLCLSLTPLAAFADTPLSPTTSSEEKDTQSFEQTNSISHKESTPAAPENAEDTTDPTHSPETTPSAQAAKESAIDDRTMEATNTELTPASAPPSGQDPVSEGEFYFITRLNGASVLDITAGSLLHGANVQLYQQNMTSAQQFRITADPVIPHVYTITSIKSGKVLGVEQNQITAEANVVQQEPTGSDTQKWCFITYPDGSMNIASALDHELVLDVDDARTANGTNIKLWHKDSLGRAAQCFTLEATRTSYAEGTYLVRSTLAWTTVIDITAASKKAGANVQLYVSNMTPAQSFRLKNDGNSLYTLENTNSGMVLGIEGGVAFAGANVEQQKPTGELSQKWALFPHNDGSLSLMSAQDNSFTLDVDNGMTENGTNIKLWTYRGNSAQRFHFIDLSYNQSSVKTLDSGYYELFSAINNTKALDIAAASKEEGTRTQIYTANHTLAQRYFVQYLDNGYYTIRNANSGKALATKEGNVVVSTPIVQASYDPDNIAQQWVIQDNGDSTYTFIARASGLVMDVCSGSSANGTALQLYTSNQTAAQKWIACKIEDDVLAEGIYTLRAGENKSIALDVVGASKKDGETIQAYESNNTLAQKAHITRTSDGYYVIRPLSSGCAFADMDNKVVQKTFTGADDQLWNIKLCIGGYQLINKQSGRALSMPSLENWTPSETALPNQNDVTQLINIFEVTTLESGYYQIALTNSSMLIDVAGASRSNKAAVQLYENNGTNAQKFYVSSLGDGFYRITNARSQKVIDVTGGQAVTGNTVQQYEWNGTPAQCWEIVPNGSGSFVFRSQLGELYLTTLSDTSNSARLGLTDSVGSALSFNFIETTYVREYYEDLLGSFTTYSTNTYAGTYNMTRALRSFDGLVVWPGQTVSFFGIAGPCGWAQGYMLAGIVGGMGYGGGICQASTTLYGATLRSGMTILQRKNHSVPSTYVPIGLDAMVDYGSSDFRFKNDLDYPIKIVVDCSGNRLTCSIYGTQPDWYDSLDVYSWKTGSSSAAAARTYYKDGSAVYTEQLPRSYYW